MQGYKGAKVQGYKGAGYKGVRVHRYMGVRVQGCKGKGAIVSIYEGTEHATGTCHRYMVRMHGKGT